MNLVEELEVFIKKTKEGREMKRAIAVKMKVQGKNNPEIQALLGCSQSFISKWKNQVLLGGVEQLKLHYKGSKSYLSLSQKTEVIQWLQSLDYCEREKLQLYIEQTYGVIFQSLQSYYNLLHSAKISWKKTQKTNPRLDPLLVKKKRKEIETKLTSWQADITSGRSCCVYD